MLAGEQGKIGIIQRAKSPPTAPVIRYRDARRALCNALLRPARGSGVLESARESFDQKSNDPSLSPAAQDDAEKSIDVINAFPALSNQLNGYAYFGPGNHQNYLTISGVSVSVNLDLLVNHTIRGTDVVGGLIFRLTKPEEEETEAAQSKRHEVGAYAATLIHMQVAENFATDRAAHRSICWSVDVQNREIYTAPRQYRMRQRNLEAACRMIAAMWHQI